MKTCKVDNCNKPVCPAKGVCWTHYRRMRKYGCFDLPAKSPRQGPAKAEEQFWARVEQSPTCWNWIGTRNGQGYGVFHHGRLSWLAHRFSYIVLNGPIPSGLEIDHMCFNPSCVRPDHLDAVTHAENMRRSAMAGRMSRTPKNNRSRAFDVKTLTLSDGSVF
jgi:hypothetical protein